MSGAALALQARARAGTDSRAARRWWLAAAAALVLAVTVQPFRDPDVWWHLALGRYIVEHGIPSHEPFSFLTAGNPWVHQQWLYEVGLYRIVSSGPGGPGLASLLMGGVAAVALLVAALAVPRAGRVPGAWLAASMVLSGLVMAQVAGVRGQVITLLGAALVVLLVNRWREGSARALWALPVVFLVWANLHAGFIVGFAVLAIALLTASPLAPATSLRRRPLLLAALACAAATLVNPAGPGLYRYVAETFLNPTLTSAIVEWLSPDFHNAWYRLFEAQVVLLVVLWTAAGGPRRYDLALAGAAVVATLQAQRNVSLFAVVAVPQVAWYGWQVWGLRVRPALVRRRTRARNPLPALGGVAAALGIAVAVTFTTLLPNTSPAMASAVESSRYPRAAADYVAAHLPGRRLYSPDVWGGYLAYRFPQGRVVFLYGETAAFGTRDLQQYEAIHQHAPNWTDVLHRYRIADAVVPLHSQDASGFHALGWGVDCYDPTSEAVVMSAPSTASASVPPPLLDGANEASRC